MFGTFFPCFNLIYMFIMIYRNGGSKKGSGDSWKRPVVIRGLGIVSRIELAFLVMFIALLVWSFSNYLHNGFANVTPASAAKSGEKV